MNESRRDKKSILSLRLLAVLEISPACYLGQQGALRCFRFGYFMTILLD